MKLIRVRNKKTTISRKDRAIEQIFVLDPVNYNILGMMEPEDFFNENFFGYSTNKFFDFSTVIFVSIKQLF